MHVGDSTAANACCRPLIRLRCRTYNPRNQPDRHAASAGSIFAVDSSVERSGSRARAIKGLRVGATLALALWAGCQAQNLTPAGGLRPQPDSGAAGTRGQGDCYIASACPLTVPAQGLPCAVTAIPCEYGDDPRWSCNTLATCTASGWSVQQPTTDPASGCPTPQPACPPTFPASPDAIVSCSSGLSYECVYPEGNCLCGGGGLECVARPHDLAVRIRTLHAA